MFDAAGQLNSALRRLKCRQETEAYFSEPIGRFMVQDQEHQRAFGAGHHSGCNAGASTVLGHRYRYGCRRNPWVAYVESRGCVCFKADAVAWTVKSDCQELTEVALGTAGRLAVETRA